MKWYNKLFHTLESCYLCCKFPFLYPRNRFTGKHVVNVLGSILRKLYLNSIQEISITGHLEKDTKELLSNTVLRGNSYTILWKESKKLIISNEVDYKEYDLSKLLWSDDKFEILGLSSWDSGNGNYGVTVHVKTIDESDTTNYGFHYESVKLIKNKFKYFIYKFLSWVDEKILDRILFIPTFTELDAMEPGWRKAFGIQMCKELKAQLKKDHYLYQYRIMQIKEKFGGLRWYDAGSSKELQKIIQKYEEISYNTCIVCGKPATKISSGWICPYCDEHFPSTSKIYKVNINGTWKYAEDEEEI